MKRPMNATRGMGAMGLTAAFTMVLTTYRERFDDGSVRVKMSAKSPT